VLHAVVNALLGAAALGDIGTHFPSSDERWKNVGSATFVDYTYKLLCEQQWKIGNVDVMVVAQRPRIAPYVQAMRANLAELLHVDIEQVSVKAATTDGLGFVGRLEGIASYAVALIER
jgi:2-C-methyl-D-erythritol 2,4-cyclodiphosphate synthase